MDTPDLEAAALADAIHRFVAMADPDAVPTILADLPDVLSAETFGAARSVAKRLYASMPETEEARFIDLSPTRVDYGAPPVIKALAEHTARIMRSISDEARAERGPPLSPEDETETIVAGTQRLGTVITHVDPGLADFVRKVLAEEDGSEDRRAAALAALDKLANKYVEIARPDQVRELYEYSVHISFSTGMRVSGGEPGEKFITPAKSIMAHHIGQALARSLKEAAP